MGFNLSRCKCMRGKRARKKKMKAVMAAPSALDFTKKKKTGGKMPRKTKIRYRTRFARFRSRSRRGSRGMNIKAMVAGGIGLIGVKMVRERFINLGNYNTPADSIITGAVMKMLKLDNGDLISAGIKQGVAQVGRDLLAGTLFGGTTVSGEGV
jgi:hypothetical protein